MVRAVLCVVGPVGGLLVGTAGMMSDTPVGIFHALAVGVGLLVFVAALGLADLINATYQVRDVAHHVADAIGDEAV
jgi:hypothetical protein